MVTVGDITRYLIPKGSIALSLVLVHQNNRTVHISTGYTLAVTLEIADATLGGLAFGVGMTTYSHRVSKVPIGSEEERLRRFVAQVGLYQETIAAYEVVLADGTLARVTRDNEYADLYHCLPWSHGTLGFLVALELQIIPVKVTFLENISFI